MNRAAPKTPGNRTAGGGRGYHSALANAQVLIRIVSDQENLIKSTAGGGRGYHSALANAQVLIRIVSDQENLIKSTAGGGRGYHSALADARVLIRIVSDQENLIKSTAGGGRGYHSALADARVLVIPRGTWNLERGTIRPMQPRVRFAPSPTGFLHIGGARTALFNWLFARGEKGTLVLRIEDTDARRSEEDLTEGILEGLRWLGIEWDEGPHFQSRRTALYREVAESLLASDSAYYCFCDQAGDQEPTERQRHDCPRLSPGESAARASREPAVIRFRVAPQRTLSFRDIVYGAVSVESDNIEDFALMRPDGSPTYHLSVVVDDFDMSITHVIRGADHLSNTCKQVLLYEALGKPPPRFAHLPLILGPDKTRLSKRHGATSVLEFRRQGFLPLAIRNYLARLGWSPKTDQEFFSDQELAAAFSLDRVNKANAVLDLQKLDWINGKVLGATPLADLEPLVRETLREQGLLGGKEPTLSTAEFRQRVELLQGRARRLTDFGARGKAFFTDRFQYDPVVCQKHANSSDPDWRTVRAALQELVARYQAVQTFDLENTESILRAIAQKHDLKPGRLIGTVRVALTGEGVAPGIFDVIVTLGRETVFTRINHLLATFA